MANKERVQRMKELVIPSLKIDIENGIVYGVKGKPYSATSSQGYVIFQFKKKQYYVHEIIAVAGGLDIVDKTVNHKDGNKKNNRISNLESITRGENMVHAWETGLNNGRPFKHTPDQLNQIRERLEDGWSYRKIARELDFVSDHSHVSQLIKKGMV